LPELIWDHTC